MLSNNAIKFLSRRLIALSATATLALAGCSPVATIQNTPDETKSLTDVLEENPDAVLPTQNDIRVQKTIPYLMTSPTTEHFDAKQWQKTSTRIPATQKQLMSDHPLLAEQVNQKCVAYEQLGLGLFTTPGGKFTIQKGERRRIALGQNGIDQLSGYISVFSVADATTAQQLISTLEKNSADCTEALTQLYPGSEDAFEIHRNPTPSGAPSNPDLTSLSGQYSGDAFGLRVSRVDNFLVSTWFRTTEHHDDSNVMETTDFIHRIAIDKAEKHSSAPRGGRSQTANSEQS